MDAKKSVNHGKTRYNLPSQRGVNMTDTVAVPIGMKLEDAEKKIILATFRRYQNMEMTAAVLGISLKTLYNRRRAYGLDAFFQGSRSA